MSFLDMPVKQGWQCPKCGRIYAPTILGCQWCNNDVKWWTCVQSSPTAKNPREFEPEITSEDE